MRKASVERKTKETSIKVSVNLDGKGAGKINTGIGFFDHMLMQIACHGLIDLNVEAKGDLHIDAHHTVEDVGICIGQALRKAWGDRKGLVRMGTAYVPLDEALTRTAIDLSGRPYFVWNVAFTAPKIGDFDVELVEEFFKSLCFNAQINLHIETLHGRNNHHIAETCFKSCARALRAATAVDPRAKAAVPSTKGTL
ncbi:MAG: imidazoleglycerol-phosphate dehydratase HisB [Alphaproteobacteria bacterium]|nr:imidazoleglycerol-phosphate dehydratase HisB [Alphaproteobacteria bacterium]